MSLPKDRETAARMGADIRTVRAWRRRGAPMDDPDALKLWVEAQRSGPINATPKDIHEAKLLKLQLECERLKRGNDEDAGNVVQKKVVAADARILASAVRSQINVLIGECPAWAGLKPHELQARAKDWGRVTEKAFHDKASALYGKI